MNLARCGSAVRCVAYRVRPNMNQNQSTSAMAELGFLDLLKMAPTGAHMPRRRNRPVRDEKIKDAVDGDRADDRRSARQRSLREYSGRLRLAVVGERGDAGPDAPERRHGTENMELAQEQGVR